jgi:outer membrane receptor for ferric coprogen and ferric-rhodotorulic acid
VNHHLLPAAEGNSYEGGVKSQWFDNHVLATFAIFKSEQLNLATAAGTFPDGKNYYTGVDTSVFGYEARLTGALTDQWSINAGWTELHVKDPQDVNTNTYIPRETFKLSTTYLVPTLNDLRLGAALRWKSETSIMDLVEVSQGAYAVIDLMAGVRVFDNLQATLNVDNVTDEKYWTSMQWNQSFYGEPRSVTFRLSYAY